MESRPTPRSPESAEQIVFVLGLCLNTSQLISIWFCPIEVTEWRRKQNEHYHRSLQETAFCNLVGVWSEKHKMHKCQSQINNISCMHDF